MAIEKKDHTDYENEQYANRQSNTDKELRELRVRSMFRDSFLNDPWTGTIEQRLLDGYLYSLSHDDLSMSKEELLKEKEDLAKKGFVQKREVFVQTGKAGVIAFVEAGRRLGNSEETIAKAIWLQMSYDDVELYVNIKCLRVKDDEKNTTEEENIPQERGTDKEETGKRGEES